MNAGTVLARVGVFAVSSVASALAVTVAMGALADRTPVSTAGVGPDAVLAGVDTPAGPGPVAAFAVVADGTPAPLPSADPVDLNAAAAALLAGTGTATGGGPVNPSGFPRIQPITQFDGGPFENANCTLTSGAMLARLAFGIVTTGSTLRTLQDDQDGGTGLNDLSTAFFRGYGVHLDYGMIRPATLKELLGAGYGAVIQGIYGEIPRSLRLSKDFTDGHAIYLDGYYPGDPAHGIPEAYYVIDPIGRPHAGYEGDWWPASVVDQFALALSGSDRVAAMWGFPPGGSPPDVGTPDVLPIPADPGPGATPEPGASESPAPVVPEPGDVSPPPAPPIAPPIAGPETGGVLVVPIFDICLAVSPPDGCPAGLSATFDRPVIKLPSFSLGPKVTVLAVDSPQANIALVWFSVDADVTGDVRFWPQGATGSVRRATSVTTSTLFGAPAQVARLDVDANTSYQFQAVAGNGIFEGQSAVGSFTTGAGVQSFTVKPGTTSSPSIRLDSGLSPYLRAAAGAFVRPLLRVSEAAGCRASAKYGSLDLCLDDAAEATLAACSTVDVAWTLSGIDADSVTIRAFPAVPGVLPDGTTTLSGVVEAGGAAPSGSVNVGCLTPGLTYTIALDAVGDDRGYLAVKTVVVP